MSSQFKSPRIFFKIFHLFHNLLQKLLHAPGLAHPSALPSNGATCGLMFSPPVGAKAPRRPGSSKITVQSLRKLIYISLGIPTWESLLTYYPLPNWIWPCLEITAHSQRILESCLALMEELICVICAAKRGINKYINMLKT